MDFQGILTNPYVLIGGVALGVIMLAKNGSGAPVSSGANQAAINSAVVAYNTAALGEVTKQAAISADVGKHIASTDATKYLGVLAVIKNADDNNRIVAAQRIASNQGIIQSQIQSQAAIVMDVNNNATRLGMAQQQTQQTQITSNAAVEVAHQQAKAAKNAAQMGLFGDLIKTVGSVVAAPFTGGLSLAALGSLGSSIGVGSGTFAVPNVPTMGNADAATLAAMDGLW